MPILRSGTFYDTLQDYYGLGEESDKNKQSNHKKLDYLMKKQKNLIKIKIQKY